MLATLTEAPTNPHAKKDAGPVLQVSVNGATVGHLTPAMSERLRRMTNRSQPEGRRVTCSAHVFRGEKRGQPMLEIRLSAEPHAHDENVVAGQVAYLRQCTAASPAPAEGFQHAA